MSRPHHRNVTPTVKIVVTAQRISCAHSFAGSWTFGLTYRGSFTICLPISVTMDSNVNMSQMGRRMDNIDFAVLSKIQELTNRFGIRPYDFIATLDHSPEVGGMGVKFEIPVETSESQEARVREMLQIIGVDGDRVLKGGEIAVIDTLDNALEMAPRARITR